MALSFVQIRFQYQPCRPLQYFSWVRLIKLLLRNTLPVCFVFMNKMYQQQNWFYFGLSERDTVSLLVELHECLYAVPFPGCDTCSWKQKSTALGVGRGGGVVVQWLSIRLACGKLVV